jgi:hypothetical protein
MSHRELGGLVIERLGTGIKVGEKAEPGEYASHLGDGVLIGAAAQWLHRC